MAAVLTRLSGCWPARVRWSAATVARTARRWATGLLERALAANGVDHDIKVYPEASHGFLNNHPPDDQTPLLMVLNRISGTRYHEPSAQDARRRIVAFFDAHLKS